MPGRHALLSAALLGHCDTRFLSKSSINCIKKADCQSDILTESCKMVQNLRWKRAGIPLVHPLILSLFKPLLFSSLVHMKGQLMVTPQGSKAKEDKTKNKEKKRRRNTAMQAKTGLLIEDSSWSVSHLGWAGLACSDFTPVNANINGGLLSDPMLRTSLGTKGVGGWEEERSWTMGCRWWLCIFFFKKYITSIRSFLKLSVNTNHLYGVLLTYDINVIITIKWGQNAIIHILKNECEIFNIKPKPL